MIRIRVLCAAQNKYEVSIDRTVTTTLGIFDITDVPHSPITYSCRNVACGSCLRDVDDPSLLEPPDEDELSVLRDMGANRETQRIACACRLKQNASGTIKIKKGY